MKFWIVNNTAYGMKSSSKFKTQNAARAYAGIMRPQYPKGSITVEKVVRRGKS